MALNIVINSELTQDQIYDLNKLYEVCNKQDKTKYVFDEDDDFKEVDDINTFLLYDGDALVSSINIFAPTKNEAEIIALTDPNSRNCGYFKKLLQNAVKEIRRRDIKSILFVCDSNSNDGNRTISKMNSEYEYSEYLLKFEDETKLIEHQMDEIEISIADENDKEALIDINSRAFNTKMRDESGIIDDFFKGTKRKLYSIKLQLNVIGMIGVYEEENRNYIFGFCIDPDFQGRGIGKITLSEIVKCLPGNKEIVLEVQADNINALSLYQNVGFSIEAEFKYYRSTFFRE
ncbi:MULTISPECIES: N-acetyltransferase [unclassified Oceanispirochaeta]|uniref:GNAT family N-acetyltransferase n=1 Tax=unclassified Oceanispirochaeta TaxID=2635722 RepID=UPI000E091B39|nr:MULTISPECIES: GNAT family N-acetyltransferase [unclassified Oceanispirochaeta]MBF9017467.1 GNAT family N-acetyltransferase [Oceanispirochaeta sp. M2]NPD74039.1 GNAT family N-acetyltransferase [Oceanispirochaeta sp. M1]RDG30206.1 GNAT family N-acetyltransferase [Oceanispirochaeta sp. M1]